MTTNTSNKIISYIADNKEASPKELIDYLDISDRAVFKQLANLLSSGMLENSGTPPKVYYRIASGHKPQKSAAKLDGKVEKLIDENFLYITPLGEYFEGIDAFTRWCEERKLDVKKQASQYQKLISDLDKKKKNGLIDATEKFRSTFEQNYLAGIFYVDFYSIPQFGKTKLGQLLLYAKQSQDKARIKILSNVVKARIEKLVKAKKIEAVGFIPPTIKREVQFMKELERHLALKLPALKITKLKTPIIVPQKTLSKLSDRIINAKNTIVVEDKRKFKNILLIDDAVGSGATLNETAKKIIEKGLAAKVYGLAVTGSYKGFDVISEV